MVLAWRRPMRWHAAWWRMIARCSVSEAGLVPGSLQSAEGRNHASEYWKFGSLTACRCRSGADRAEPVRGNRLVGLAGGDSAGNRVHQLLPAVCDAADQHRQAEV